MTVIEIILHPTPLALFELIGAIVALILQICVFVVAKPVRRYVSARLWILLMCVNCFELLRRLLTLAVVVNFLNRFTVDLMHVVVCLLISASLLAFVAKLRAHAKEEAAKSEELADATVKLADKFNARDSLAYQLAVHFIHLREQRKER